MIKSALSFDCHADEGTGSLVRVMSLNGSVSGVVSGAVDWSVVVSVSGISWRMKRS